MEKKNKVIEKISAGIVIGIMIAFLLSIIGCAIAIKCGATDLFKMDHDIETKIYDVKKEDSLPSRISKGYENSMYAAKNYVDAYSNDLLLGRHKIVEAAVRYKNIIGWKMYAPGEYNSILYLDDGYLANANAEEDADSIHKIATKIKGLKEAADEAQADFLYMQTPGNIDKYGDEGINNVKDFANKNADLLLDDLKKYNIDCFDMREDIHESFEDYHSIFYKTDHHWRQPVALWATSDLAAYLNKNYAMDFDTSLYDVNRYDVEVKKEYYLGSLGKRATLAATKPDDFEILYPKFDTDIRFIIEDKDIDKSGDFSVTYDYEKMNEDDIYWRECYLALLSFYGTGSAKVINNNAPNDTKLLIVGDSLAIPMVSLLALGCEEAELIDPRYFEGSIKDYIKDTKPDMVINTYSTTIIQDYYPIFDF